MGNTESNPVRNVDKRTARRDHAPKFITAISNFRGVHADELGNVVLDEPPDDPERALRAARVRVCVRRRPIFLHELKAGEFDVLTCSRTAICVHDGRLHADCRHLFMKHHTFPFDRVFDERTSSDAVFADAVAPLVRACVEEGAPACVLMYGQTGSGKTFTMSALVELASERLFELLAASATEGAGGPQAQVSVTYVEVAGSGVRDMLNGGEDARLLADGSGEVQVVPQLEVAVSSASQLLALVRYAQALRATAATGVHDASSRSHAICTVHVRRDGVCGVACAHGCACGGGGPGGSLALIDLAGSEQRIDTDAHSAQRTRESAAINSSLMALKDGVRAIAAGEPFSTPAGGRQALTQLLRPFFEAASARTLVLATVSPASKDTEHALNTLRHASLMDGRPELAEPHARDGGARRAARDAAGGGGEARAAPSRPSVPSRPSFIRGGCAVTEELGEIDFAGTQARIRMALDHAKQHPPRSSSAGSRAFGGARDGLGSDAHDAAAARAQLSAQRAAFLRAERTAARALAAAEPGAYAALLREREAMSRGPRLNRFQAERLRSRLRSKPQHQPQPQQRAPVATGVAAQRSDADGLPPSREGSAGSARHGRRASSAASGEAMADGAPRPLHGRRASAEAGHERAAAYAPRAEADDADAAEAAHSSRARAARVPSAARRSGAAAAAGAASPRESASAGAGGGGGGGGSGGGGGVAGAAAQAEGAGRHSWAALLQSPHQLSDKLAAARARREATDAARREALLRRQEAKGTRPTPARAACTGADMAGGWDREAGAPSPALLEIARIHAAIEALPAGPLHAQARAGLTRQLAARKAAARREQQRAEAAADAGAEAADGGGEEAGAVGRSRGPAALPPRPVARALPMVPPPSNGRGDAACQRTGVLDSGPPLPARPPPAGPAPSRALVVQSYCAQDADELSVCDGEHVEVVADDGVSEWVEVASLAGALGLVPRDCLDGLV